MNFRRITVALVLAMVALLAGAALSQADRGAGSGPAATASPAADAGGSLQAEALPSVSAAAQRVDAVRTVKLFCDLVGSRRFWQAAGLFAAPRVWTRGQLRAVRRLDFRSARIDFAPDSYTLVVIARVHAGGTSGSPLHDGDTTLFFTLGRVGTTAGGWLITAVTASP